MTLQCAARDYPLRGIILDNDYYFKKFSSSIELESNVISRPLTTIKGRLVIDTNHELTQCYGIRVQLNATVKVTINTKYQDKSLNKENNKEEGLIQGSLEIDANYYIKSPVGQDLQEYRRDSGDGRKPRNSNGSFFLVSPGRSTYQFTLTFPDEPLPSPFKNEYGDLEYAVVAYMITQHNPIAARTGPSKADKYMQIAKCLLKFKGYNNISQLSSLGALKTEQTFNKSMFSKKKSITACLTVEKQGYLPGEVISLKLTISNPAGYLIRKVQLCLVQRKQYRTRWTNKITNDNLDSFERNDVNHEKEAIYQGTLSLFAKNCTPTYNLKIVYSVSYLVQYEITVAEYTGTVKGQVEIIVGTTNEPLEVLLSRRLSTLQIDDGSPSGSRRRPRSNSVLSRLSDTSAVSLPPAYSQLSSRAISMISIETLPPEYKDVIPKHC